MTELDVTARSEAIRNWYEAAQWRYRAFERTIFAHFRRLLVGADLGHHQVESRTKSLGSYVAKAVQPDPVAREQFKYLNPSTEITDAVGLRVIVPLSTDVMPVKALLHERYVVEEEAERGADTLVDVPGYQSLHLLIRLSEADKRDPEFRDMQDMTAEVQVRTILQHAWASLQHDLMYKTDRPPTPSLKRRLVALAGVLELADREFVQVRHEHAEAVRVTGGGTMVVGAGAVTPTSVRQLVGNVVGETEGTDQAWFDSLHSVLGELGLTDRRAVVARLGSWGNRASEVASAVMSTRPYANSAYVFDQLLRLSMGEEYFQKRLPQAEIGTDADARRNFLAERSRLLNALESNV